MAHGKQAYRIILRIRSKIDRLDPYLVQMAAAEPPALRFAAIERLAQVSLRGAGIEARSARSQRNDVTRAVCQYQQVAAAQFPDISGGVLDGRPVLGGHQGPNIWQVGKQGCRPGQCFFLLRLKALIVGYGVADVLANVFPDSLPHTVADDE